MDVSTERSNDNGPSWSLEKSVSATSAWWMFLGRMYAPTHTGSRQIKASDKSLEKKRNIQLGLAL